MGLALAQICEVLLCAWPGSKDPASSSRAPAWLGLSLGGCPAAPWCWPCWGEAGGTVGACWEGYGRVALCGTHFGYSCAWCWLLLEKGRDPSHQPGSTTTPITSAGDHPISHDPSHQTGSITSVRIHHDTESPSHQLGTITSAGIYHTNHDPSHQTGSITSVRVHHDTEGPS